MFPLIWPQVLRAEVRHHSVELHLGVRAGRHKRYQHVLHSALISNVMRQSSVSTSSPSVFISNFIYILSVITVTHSLSLFICIPFSIYIGIFLYLFSLSIFVK